MGLLVPVTPSRPFGPPLSIEQQVRVILNVDPFEALAKAVGVRYDPGSVRYRDLISASDDEIVAFIVEHGWGDCDMVVEARAVPLATDDVWCFETSDGSWTTYYTERGVKRYQEFHATLAAARASVARRMVRDAHVGMNYRYWATHGLPYPVSIDD